MLIVFAVRKARLNYLYWNDRGVNYEKPEFPFGNLKGIGKNMHLSDHYVRLYEKFKKKGRYFGMFTFCLSKTFVLTDLDLIKTIFIKDFFNFNERGLYFNKRDDPISEHLMTLEGKPWKTLRSKLTPTFTSAKMKLMFHLVLKVAEELVSVLKDDVCKSEEVDMKDLLGRFATDVIGTCAFGIDCNSLRDPNTEFFWYEKKTIKCQYDRFSRTMFLQNFQKLAKFLRMRFISQDCSDYFIKTVQQTLKYREENNFRRKDFMDLLMDLKNKSNGDNPEGLTSMEVTAQSFIFILAGFETSSSTMGFMLYELAANADVQLKLRDHVKEILEKHNGQMTYECIKEMTYLEQIIFGEFIILCHL